MRIKATIKCAIKGMLAQWKQILLMFVAFPLIIAVIMGNFQKDIFKPEVNGEKINIKIIDEDNSKASKNFIQLFETKALKEIFNITDEAQYEIIIDKGYENEVTNLKGGSIKVKEKKRISSINELIIRNVIEQYGKNLAETMIISKNVGAMDVKDKEKLFNDTINSLNLISNSASLKQNLIKGERVLTAYENQAASMMTLMVFSIILSCIAGYNMDKENESNKRLMSTPMTKFNFFNLDLLLFFSSSLIYGTLYILAFKITGLAFRGVNLLNIIAILVCQSILIACISGIIIAFFRKGAANIIVIVLMYIHIIFGGGFVPLKGINNNVFLAISKFSPGNVISETYVNSILFNSFSKISNYLAIMLIVSLVTYLASILIVKLRWE